MTIVAVVEGPGDEAAIKLLLRRWFHLHQVYTLPKLRILVTHSVGKLLASHDAQKQLGVEYWVSKAQNYQPRAILILLDADEECERPKHKPPGVGLGPWLLSRARSIVGHIPISVVVADRCFESWFFCPPSQHALLEAGVFQKMDLSAAEYARGRWVGRLKMLMGQAYSKSADQVRLTMHMPLGEEMAIASRSFRKLRQELTNLCNIASVESGM